MKKMPALLLIALLSFGMSVQPYAADDLTFSIASLDDATIGDTVTVPISVSNNPGFTAVGLVLTYDPLALEIRNVTAPVAAMPLNSQFLLTRTPGAQWIHLINTRLADWTGNGVVAHVTFNVKPTAPVGVSRISLAFTSIPNGTPANASGNVLTGAKVFSGTLNIMDSPESASPQQTAAHSKPAEDDYSSQPKDDYLPYPVDVGTHSGTDDLIDDGGFIGAVYKTKTPSADTVDPVATTAPVAINTPAAATTVIASSTPTATPMPSTTTEPAPTVEPAAIAESTDVNATEAFSTPAANTASAVTSEPEAAITEISESGGTSGTRVFGTVPQTGITAPYTAIAAMCIGLLASLVLWVYLARRHFGSRNSHGKA